jgi:hypothetical protein
MQSVKPFPARDRRSPSTLHFVAAGRATGRAAAAGRAADSADGSADWSVAGWRGRLSPDCSRNPSRDSGDARSCKARDARPTKAYSMQYVEEGELAQRSKCGQIRCRSRIS